MHCAVKLLPVNRGKQDNKETGPSRAANFRYNERLATWLQELQVSKTLPGLFSETDDSLKPHRTAQMAQKLTILTEGKIN